MANEHVLTMTDNLEDAKQRMKHLKQAMESLGLGEEAKFYIMKAVPVGEE